MIKNEKEFQRWLRDQLLERDVYAKKIETPFDKGISDIYTVNKFTGKVTWLELKWLKFLTDKYTRTKLAAKVIKLPTALQREFLEEQHTIGVGAMVVTGYYSAFDKDKRQPEPYFAVEQYPFNKTPWIGLNFAELYDLIRGVN